MLLLKNKLDKNLKIYMSKNLYKTYRVIIHCNLFIDKVQLKIKGCKGDLIGSIKDINCVFASISANCIERLIELPEVAYISFDGYAYVYNFNHPSNRNVTYNVKSKFTGKNQCIGIIDSGVYPHPELISPSKKIAKFVDVINGFNYPYDDNGHGTFVSGIISSLNGVSKACSLYCIKAFNFLGRAYLSHILIALNTLFDDAEKMNIKVICLPFETYNMDCFVLSLFQKMFDIAVKKNITIVIPSGSMENIKNSITGIATLENCITVGGIDSTDNIAIYKYSSSGPICKKTKPDLVAPCVNILSLNADTNYISERNGMKIYPRKLDKLYTNLSGTYCSAAYISGICALLYESNSELKFKDIQSLIKASCIMLDTPKWQQGEGVLNLDILFNKE